jgi:murein L,D-transpeptidase YcbB/YkuD
MINNDDMTDYTPEDPVKVILGYWTAWPDGEGAIRYYPDIYNLDGEGANCAGVITRDPKDGYPQSSSPNGRLIWREY